MIGNKPGMVLQERDLHLLREIATMRIVDGEQARIVGGFGSRTRVNTRLLALTRAALLRRFFLGTKAGPTKALYSISAKSAELLGTPVRGPRRRQNEVLVGEAAVLHQLAVNSVYCALKYRPVPSGSPQLKTWQCFYEPLAPSTKLIPDAYAEIAGPKKSVALFFEIDLGTEALRIWHEKVHSYLRYAASGDFERRFPLNRFRVLALANAPGRLDSLRKVTASLTEKIFWFATLDSINRDGFWSPIWFRPKVDSPPAQQLL
jgi:hypothetical protein